MANRKQEIRTSDRIIGVSIIAKELNVSRWWVWAVRDGRGTSERVRQALEKYGIPCKPYRH